MAPKSQKVGVWGVGRKKKYEFCACHACNYLVIAPATRTRIRPTFFTFTWLRVIDHHLKLLKGSSFGHLTDDAAPKWRAVLDSAAKLRSDRNWCFQPIQADVFNQTRQNRRVTLIIYPFLPLLRGPPTVEEEKKPKCLRALTSIGPTSRRTVPAVRLEVGPIDNSALRHLGFFSPCDFGAPRNSDSFPTGPGPRGPEPGRLGARAEDPPPSAPQPALRGRLRQPLRGERAQSQAKGHRHHAGWTKWLSRI